MSLAAPTATLLDPAGHTRTAAAISTVFGIGLIQRSELAGSSGRMWAGFEQAAAADQPKHAPVAIDQLTDQASTIQSLDQFGRWWTCFVVGVVKREHAGM